MLEAVYEGYLLHYGAPRAFAGMDEDLRLLAGDALYALGPRRASPQAGDLEAVAELADLISLHGPGPRGGAARGRERALGAQRAALSQRAAIGSPAPRACQRRQIVRSVTMLALLFHGRDNPSLTRG